MPLVEETFSDRSCSLIGWFLSSALREMQTQRKRRPCPPFACQVPSPGACAGGEDTGRARQSPCDALAASGWIPGGQRAVFSEAPKHPKGPK